jgi:advillin
VQFREVQGHESDQFLSYFKNTGGISYETGGIQSGFKKVEKDVYTTRLLHCKGKRTVRVTEVPVAVSSLNKGDVFILDKGLSLFIFNGPTANKFEKAKGIDVASKLNSDERGGRAQILLLDDDPKNNDFWSAFGGYKDPASLPEGPDDATVDTKTAQRQIFKISDASGKMEFISVTPADGKLVKETLDTNDCFLVAGASGKIFLWIGKKSNANEKKEATHSAVTYLTQNGLPAHTAIERVSEGCETAAFKGEFTRWDPPASFGMKVSDKPNSSANESPENVKDVLSRATAEDTPVDDGKGKLQVWVIKDFKKEPVDQANYGEFYSGDSYILLYTYMKGRSEEYIIYYWLGNNSTNDEKGAAALLSVELDDSMGGKPVQVRVVQGKEPGHFRQLFQGKMIVYQGGNDSGFSKAGGHSALAEEALFHVRGTSALNTVALQVGTAASSLNSQDSFVLVTGNQVFVWSGVGSNEAEQAVAMNVGTILAARYKGKAGRAVVQVKEGSESEEFWAALGGKGDYASVGEGHAMPRDARLFSASTATGRFHVEPVRNNLFFFLLFLLSLLPLLLLSLRWTTSIKVI